MIKLVIKYLTDTITDEELLTLFDWLKSRKNQHIFKVLSKVNQNLDLSYMPIDVESAYQKTFGVSENIERPTRKKYRIFAKYAAILIVLFSTVLGIRSLLNTYGSGKADNNPKITLEIGEGALHTLEKNGSGTIFNEKNISIATLKQGTLVYNSSKKSEIDSTLNQLTVPYGKRFELKLSDGSTIFLNAGSRLKYPRFFTGQNNREVYLEGEAFFNIQENKSQPFIVHTEKMNVRVYGTKFNVTNYKDDNQVSAVLTEGSIAVYNPILPFNEEKLLVIKPGQRVATSNDVFIVQEIDPEKYIAWSENKLHFVNDRFGEIIKKLERHFNTVIENRSPQLNDLRYTGTFTTETLTQILDAFRSHTAFEYKLTKNKIIIEDTTSKQ
ncbi:FecR family protein [Flagellimonas sp.]|uniref:FecR family protein n=1 Tax=Flagellimonas sp. TaxID=2058762 RepID=UPI003B59313A